MLASGVPQAGRTTSDLGENQSVTLVFPGEATWHLPGSIIRLDQRFRCGHYHDCDHRIRYAGPVASRICYALIVRLDACTRTQVRVQAQRYRRLPGIEVLAISSETDPASTFFSLFCLGLRASLLPLRFAMTASFPTARHARLHGSPRRN